MYYEKFIAVVKVNGKVLREQGDVVTLPFGAEYSLFFKNLESRRVGIKISIDSKDVLAGHRIVLEPDSETELKGFMDGETVKNKFKFIQKTQQISDHRGDNIDDGFIRIEFAYETPKPIIRKTIISEEIHRDTFYYHSPFNLSKKGVSQQKYESGEMGSGNSDMLGLDNHVYSSQLSNDQPREKSMSRRVVMDSLNNEPLQDEGITVKGSETLQEFNYTTMREMDEPNTIIIRLKGTSSKGTFIEKPITVDTKLKCETCGNKSKSNVKFCSNCGTCLQ